jgi:ABC-2 type transport system permease protein
MAASGATGDSPLFLVDYLLRLLRVVVPLALWRLILAHRGVVSGYSLGDVLTYTLIAAAFAEQLNPHTELDTAFWLGTLPVTMLQPVSLVTHFAADMCGRWLPGLILFTVPLLLVTPLLGVDPAPAGPVAAILFMVSMALGVTIGLAVEFLFGGLTVALDQGYWVIARIRTAFTVLLSGALLPLALLPWHLGETIALLPFASIASAPLRIYTGTGNAAGLIALQLSWCVVLWPLTLWLWRANRGRMVSYGG